MENYPFTNEGFQDLQQQLYVLTDLELESEAAEIRTDFIAWMISNFALQPSQLIFIGGIEVKAARWLAEQTAFAIENRLPISLQKETPEEDDEQGKIIWPKSTLTATAGQGYSASGTLEIHIAY
ncbi:hypothetical protein ACVWYG_003453 [Pedobacter sp. UYEF25]